MAIGGGTGLSALLRGVKKYTGNIVAIVTVADDGGSSGRLREEYRVLPPGDIRQCLTALAETEPLMTELFQYRFGGEGALAGHSFGNLFITAMAEITGDFEHAIRESGRVLAVRGQIVPATLRDVVLCATAGTEVQSRRVEVSQRRRADRPRVPRAAGRGDQPRGRDRDPGGRADHRRPGSLYTSILPNLLIEGMVEALRASPAVKVYVCNIAGQPGETMGYSVSEHLNTIEDHVGVSLFDYVIVNSNVGLPLPPSAVEAGVTRVGFDRDQATLQPVNYILADVASTQISTHHDPEKLSKVIMKRIWR